MYLISWNVAGWSTTSQTIREHYGSLANFFNMTKADVICIQETKISRERLNQEPEKAGVSDSPSVRVAVPPVHFSYTSSPASTSTTSSSSSSRTTHPPSSAASFLGGGGEGVTRGIPGWESFWAHSGKQHRGMNGVATFVKQGLTQMCDNQPFTITDIPDEGEEEEEEEEMEEKRELDISLAEEKGTERASSSVMVNRTMLNEVPRPAKLQGVQRIQGGKHAVVQQKQAFVDAFHDEGRCVVTYLSDVIIVNVYVPNARGGTRLHFKLQFLRALQSLLARLRSGVVLPSSTSSFSSSPTHTTKKGMGSFNTRASPSLSPSYTKPRPVLLAGDLNLTYRAQDAAWWFRRIDLRVLDALQRVMQHQWKSTSPESKRKDDAKTSSTTPATIQDDEVTATAALRVIQEHVSFHSPPSEPFFSCVSSGGKPNDDKDPMEGSSLLPSPLGTPSSPVSSSHWLAPSLLPLVLSPEALEKAVECIKEFLYEEVFLILAWLQQKKESTAEEEATPEIKEKQKKKPHPTVAALLGSGGVYPAAEDRPTPCGYYLHRTTSIAMEEEKRTPQKMEGKVSDGSREPHVKTSMEARNGGEIQSSEYSLSGVSSSSVVDTCSSRVEARPGRPRSLALDCNVGALPSSASSSSSSSSSSTFCSLPRVPVENPSSWSLPRLQALAERLLQEDPSRRSMTLSTPELPPLSCTSPDAVVSPPGIHSSSISLSQLVEAGFTSVHLSDFLHGSTSSASSFSPSVTWWNREVMFPLSKLTALPPHADVSIAFMHDLLGCSPSSTCVSPQKYSKGVEEEERIKKRNHHEASVTRSSSSSPPSPPATAVGRNGTPVGTSSLFSPLKLYDSFFLPPPTASLRQGCGKEDSHAFTRASQNKNNGEEREEDERFSTTLYPYCPTPFTCWDQQRNRRQTNEGTRLDYILVDPLLLPFVERRGYGENNTGRPPLAAMSFSSASSSATPDANAESIAAVASTTPSASLVNTTIHTSPRTDGTRKRARDVDDSTLEEMPPSARQVGASSSPSSGDLSLDVSTSLDASCTRLRLLPDRIRDFFLGEYPHATPQYKDGVRRATAAGAYLPAPFGGGGVPPLPLTAREHMWYGIPSTGLFVTPPQYSDHIGVGLVLREGEEQHTNHPCQRENETEPVELPSSLLSFSLLPRPPGVEVVELHPPCMYKPPRTLFSFMPMTKPAGGGVGGGGEVRVPHKKEGEHVRETVASVPLPAAMKGHSSKEKPPPPMEEKEGEKEEVKDGEKGVEKKKKKVLDHDFIVVS